MPTAAPVRPTSRLLVLNEQNHVLLVRSWRGGRRVWIAPRRRAAADLGITRVPGDAAWSTGEERYYLCRASREQVARCGRIGDEDWSWWSAGDLDRADEPVYPGDLADRIRAMEHPPQSADAAHLTLMEGLARLPAADGKRFATLFEHGTLSVELYAPSGTDGQQPHARDEVYVVARGSGIFWNGETRRPFSAGDVLFVAAGRPHRFEDFSYDLAVWVFFYGPEGGER